MDNQNLTTLVESLAHIFETELCSDFTFVVGEDGFRIKAHKAILSARSEPFAAMCQERWDYKKIMELQLPMNNKTAVQPFLHYLYTDKISFEDMEIDDILEVTQLAHMYLVPQLLDECSAYLISSICEENCLKIYKYCQLLNKELSNKAFEFFLINLVQTYKVKDTYLQYDEDLVKNILSDDGQHVPETTLFKALLKWRDADDSRKSAFDKLLRLIRFPTMTATDFAENVVPTEILPTEDMVKIYTHISTKKTEVEYHSKPRTPLPAKGHFIPLFKEILTPRQWKQIVPSGHPTTSGFKLQIDQIGGNEKITGLRLKGMRIFGPNIFHANVASLLAHLKPLDYIISVSISQEGGGNIANVSRSIDEIAIKGLDICFSSSVILKCGLNYTITTTLQRGVGASPYVDFAFNEISITKRRVECGGRHIGMTLKRDHEAHCYIHELILSPSENEEISNCVVT